MRYEYECPGCGDVRIIERSIHEEEGTYICDNCDTEFKRKWLSAPVHFNAPGFYSRDNKPKY